MDPMVLSEKEIVHNKIKHQILNRNLQYYGEEGLRTLVFCRRKLDKLQFQEWHASYQRCSVHLYGRDELLQSLQEQLERDYEVLGVSGIEDKLQANVG
jgi:magnesium-transporting ATPase (P-type)